MPKKKKMLNRFNIIDNKLKSSKDFQLTVSELDFALRKGFEDDVIINIAENVCSSFKSLQKEMSKKRLKKLG